MKRFYRDSMHIYEASLRSEMRNMIRDPKNPYYARFLYESGLPEPGCVFGLVERAVLLYLCPDSIYYQKPEVLEYIRLMYIGSADAIHEDGTNDLLISNYRQPEYFGIPGICNAYRMMSALPNKTAEEAEITEMIEEAESFGNPMSDDEIQYEMKRANHWATIGIGAKGYYKN